MNFVCPKCGSEDVYTPRNPEGWSGCLKCHHEWKPDRLGADAAPTGRKPAFTKPTIEQLGNRFMHHPPQGDQAARYQEIREFICGCAVKCVELTPCSPEQTRALNALDEAMMLFNAAIARNESFSHPDALATQAGIRD